MPRNPIGPTFDTDDITRAGELVIYGVWANGKAPLNRRPGDYQGVYVGRVWRAGGERSGWVAAPVRQDGQPDSWSAEVDRSVRVFRTRREACVFLWGYFMGHRRGAFRPCTKHPACALIGREEGHPEGPSIEAARRAMAQLEAEFQANAAAAIGAILDRAD